MILSKFYSVKMLRPLTWLFGGIGLLAANSESQAQVLSGIDGLKRRLPMHEEVGSGKEDKQVGIFYFLWQGDKHSPVSENVWDLSKIQETHPEVFHDFNHPGWGGGAGVTGRYYYWGEPLYGYYRGDDYWVHFKNMQLLGDAGVDFLVIDATNTLIYPEQSEALMKAIKALLDQGKPAPKLVYYTNTSSGPTMQKIFETYYKTNAPIRYPETWYYLEGKPLIIGHSQEVKDPEVRKFFTFRESQWPNEPQKQNSWPWIEFQRPQKVYTNHKGEREIINVSVAQHPNLEASMGGSAFYGLPGNWGRSFRNSSPGNPETDILYGYNVQEQWDFAISQNVPFVFITGWNEWVAGKWRQGNSPRALFVDQANAEYSRDIEPAITSGLKDHYYMQMVANIRRYKGVGNVKLRPAFKTVSDLAAWKSVPVLYSDYVGDALHRDHPGAPTQPAIQYVNKSGRNDISQLKVARDSSQIYFYVNTVKPLTEPAGNDWMTLWLNVDEDYASGWNGFDLRVWRGTTLQRFSNGIWKNIGNVKSQIQGNELMISLSYEQLGVPKKGHSLELKWTDNMQKDDPMDWYINGDAAPGARFNLKVHF